MAANTLAYDPLVLGIQLKGFSCSLAVLAIVKVLKETKRQCFSWTLMQDTSGDTLFKSSRVNFEDPLMALAGLQPYALVKRF